MLHNEILKKNRKKPLFSVDDFSERKDYSREDIKKLIPQREPFLLLDKILGVDYKEGLILGYRKVSADDPIFKGHFPEYPVYPGVLEIEMIGQLGLCLQYFVTNETNEIKEDAKPANIRATKILGALFIEPVLPNDEVIITAKKLEYSEMFGTLIGQVIARNKV